MHAEASTAIAVTGERSHLRVAWLCGLVLFLEGYDIASVGYALPSLSDAWKIPPSAFTPVLTAGNVALMLGSLCAGLLGDRFARKSVLLSCVLIFGIFSAFSALASSPFQLEYLRFLTAFGLGGGLPMAIALASDFAPQTFQRQLVTLVSMAVPLGFTLGGLLASRLIATFAWPAIFVAGGMLPLVALPLLMAWLPQSVSLSSAPKMKHSPALLFQSGLATSTALLWAINAFSFLSIYFILLWLPAILHSTGVSTSQAILGTSVYGLGVIVSPPLTALFLNRLGMERVLALGLALGGLCVLAVGLLDPRFWLLLLLLAGVGIAGGCQAGINTLSALTYPPAIRSTGTGWALGAGRIGTIVGPLLGGLLLGRGISTHKIFVIVSVPMFSSSLLMLLFPRSRP